MSLARYVLIILLAVVGILGGDLMLTQHRVASLDIGPLNQQTCSTHSGLAKQLSIQVYAPVAIHSITNNLCNSRLIQQHYGSVTLSWQARETLTAINLLNQDFDVVMGREHSLNGLVPEFSRLYAPLVNFAGFSVYWFSHQPLDFTHLESYQIGLVEDTLSHTHYLLPLQDLKARHINIEDLNIRYFSDNYSLYKAFDNRQVDMISTIQQFRVGREDGLQSQLISDGNSATVFASRTLPEPVQCEVTKALKPMIKHLSAILKLTSVEVKLQGC